MAQIVSALPATLDVNDVIVGSLDQTDFPWEDVDLTTAGLQDFAQHRLDARLEPALEHRRSRAGPGPFTTTVTVSLPPASARSPDTGSPRTRCPDTVTPTAGAVGGPPASDGSDGQILEWTLADVAVDTDYTLSFRTTPGLELGEARAVARVEIDSGAATTAGVVAVVDTGRRSGEVGSALPVEGDVLYLGYVDRADDVDLYGFDSPRWRRSGYG